MQSNHVDSVSEELDHCAKCGTCRSICPIFKETLDETLVTRGKLALFQSAIQGDLKASTKLREVLDTCLMCLKCKEKCPSLVETGEVIREAREWLNQKKGLPLPLKFAFRFIIPYRKIYDWTLRIYNRFSARNEKLITRHLPLAITEPFNRLPPIARKSVLSSIRNQKSEIRNQSPRVAIFAGCLINYVYPEIYEATIRLLNKAGVSHITPLDQVCCGTPLLLYGDQLNARRLALHNIKVFNRTKAETIITMCSSCGRMLAEEYSKLRMANGEWRIPIMDIMEFITKVTSYPSTGSRQRDKLKVTSSLRTAYHPPCHLVWSRADGITRNILREISDYRDPAGTATEQGEKVAYSEVAEDLCCGGGGAFSFRHSELSRHIGQHKIDAYKNAGINTVVTNCPGCIMQLRYLLKKSDNSNIRVCHAVELLA